MRLDEGWNQIQFNLSDFTRRAYGTNYIETLRVQVKSLTLLDIFLSKLILFRFMLIAESVVSTSAIGCTAKMNFQLSSNFTFQSKIRRQRLDRNIPSKKDILL